MTYPTARWKSRSTCTWPASGSRACPSVSLPSGLSLRVEDRAVSLLNGARLGPEKFQAIFNQIIEQARATGLVHDRLRIIDATHLAAKVDLFRLPEPPPGTPAAEAPGSPDPDARFGRKSEKKSFYGYPSTWLRAVSLSNRKEHLATDADSELITAVSVTPGNVPDSEVFAPLLDHHAQEVTADKGYDTDENHQKLKRRGQRSSIIVKKNRTNTDVIGPGNPTSQRERRNIERKFAEQKKYHGLAQARYAPSP